MRKELWDWVKTFAVAFVVVVVIRLFLFDNYVVLGESMEPNFHNKERVIVNKVIYDIRKPQRGEVIVLHAPSGEDYIKRVIGLPGEKIRVTGDQVFIDDKVITEGYIAEEIRRAKEQGSQYNRDNYPVGDAEVTVPEGHVFVLGDNRPRSSDSRAIGFISFEEIVGRAEVIYWPLQDFNLVGKD
jgi:signal peptidase I